MKAPMPPEDTSVASAAVVVPPRGLGGEGSSSSGSSSGSSSDSLGNPPGASPASPRDAAEGGAAGPRRQRFLLRLVAGCLVPLVVAVVCQATYTVVTQRRVMYQALADKALSLAALMVNVAGPGMVFDDNKSVSEALGFAAKDPDFLFSMAFEGTATRKVFAYRGPDSERAGRILEAVAVTEKRVERRPGAVVASYPVESGGRVVGTIQVALRTARTVDQIRSSSIIAALISLAGVLAAVLVVLVLASRIGRRNRDMAMLLDTAGQGFLGMDASGTLVAERSAVAAAWLGPYRPGQKLWQAVAAVDPRAGEWLELGWENLAGGFPVEVFLDQIPQRLVIGNRIVRLQLKPVMDGPRLAQALVVLSDITAEVEHQRAEARGRDLVGILERLAYDKPGFFEFLEDAEHLLAAIDEGIKASLGRPADESLRRDLHTLKGNAAVIGLSHIATCCHDLEDRLGLDSGEGVLEAAEALRASWRSLQGQLSHIVGANRPGVIELHLRDLEALEASLAAGAPMPELTRMMRAWRLEPVEVRFERLAAQARELARRLGRGEIDVRIEAHGVRLERAQWLPFWRVFGHVLRNAVDHGLEAPADRLAAGKGPAGVITLRAREQVGQLVIEVEDDGRGVDWARVAERARALGLEVDRREDLARALFAAGVSTRSGVTQVSGRGVGLAAVRAACEDLGGQIAVSSVAGQGTTVRFSWTPAAHSPPAACPRPAAGVGQS
jgi:two-component system, chemotaxis family, sensor kinase CheA